jgi:hypothetical protein
MKTRFAIIYPANRENRIPGALAAGEPPHVWEGPGEVKALVVQKPGRRKGAK